ncbi:Shedu immune nuclease family protein [Chitinophaga ginsengisoli]|uniref:Uncharacterized protein DUF4263 n=1 Tax=Chitinophaga ginsengisoli TaxID=363837 RepID=A0A2P8GEA2_9BACT|nr:Shedu immune nuclease family protein [Chitinophaga ginsengisoli]PSL32276.1 uncharacterized protein DUF4263 [Chitinophaga ginsengisoli]
MARPYPSNTLQPNGQLEFQEIKPGFHRVFFTPPIEALHGMQKLYVSVPENYKRPIFDINHVDKLLTIYPYQVWGMQPMIPKYYILDTIRLDLTRHTEAYFPDAEDIEKFLSDVLPSALVEDYNYGLGFRKNYRPIVSMLEGFDVKELRITTTGPTTIDINLNTATIKRGDLELMCRSIDNITQRSQRISAALKKEAINELFVQLLTNTNPDPVSKLTNAELARRIGKSTRLMPGGATQREQKDAMTVIRQNGRKIIGEQPDELIKLRNDIELVTLEDLISRYEVMLGKQLQESHWQKLFNENPFILNMAFGIPVMKVQGEASIGGRKLSGSGDKIADFLVRNSITNNAAIIEIKTPATRLLNPKEYRSGVFTPSVEITGAVNQILDQIFMFQKEINSLKANSREPDLESYSVMGILIAGTSMTGSNEQKSFELFRGNSKSIQIVTFDELLKKLKDLHAFLCPTGSSKDTLIQEKVITSEEDLPF